MMNCSPLRNCLVILISMLLFVACSKKAGKIDWNKLKSDYSNPKDSLRLQAVIFLQENMKDKTSELVGYQNIGNDKIIYLHQLTADGIGENELKNINNNKGYKKVSVTLNDKEILSTEQLKSKIERAFKSWEDSPWCKDVSKKVFFEYLLPYKIFGEYPSNWRNTLSKDMANGLVAWEANFKLNYETHKIEYLDSVVNDFVIPQNAKWYTYSLAAEKLGSVPSFDEIKLQKGGDCFYEAAINNYLLRAAGIPAAFDIIPYWGNSNGSHSMAVYWNTGQQKMRMLLGLKYKAAKIFRRGFKNYGTWTKEIKPIIKENPFKLNFLESDDVFDVTNEHTETADVTIDVPISQSLSFAYIDVLYYDQWKPIYWAAIADGKATFKAMGKEVIYRIEYPNPDGESSFGIPFLLTEKGKLIYPVVSGKRIDLNLKAINAGSASFVKASKTYLLNYMDINGEWIPVEKTICLKDSSVSFNKFPEAYFYKLIDLQNDKKLSRVFRMKLNKQIWY